MRTLVFVSFGVLCFVPTAVEAQADAGVPADAATAPATATTSEVPGQSEVESEVGSESEAESEAESERRADPRLSAAVFPPPAPRPPAEPDPLLDEPLTLGPPPEPEWRLRLGVGASAATAGTAIASLRLIQEWEWMPHDVAPILFALTGGEVVGEYVLGLGGARIGLYGLFCQDRLVTCTGAIALRGGVIGGTTGVTYDLGGDGDARFRFDGVELAIRVGFFVVQSVTFVDLVGMVGAAF